LRAPQSKPQSRRYAPTALIPHPKIATALLLLALYTVYNLWDRSTSSSFLVDSPLEGYCAAVPGISTAEFAERQSRLGETLHALGGGTFITEPGASASYFGNLSGAHWHLSERPLLLAVSADAAVTVLTPAFEASRAKLLPIAASHVKWVAWPEYADPYATLLQALPASVRSGPVYVDGAVRHFVATGLAHARADVKPAPASVRELRERKSPAELALMACASEATVLAIRHVRSKMNIGVRESQVRGWMSDALASAGLTDTWSLVLFGENAALPHGTGSDRALGKADMALIDTGGNVHGYGSDVTRVGFLFLQTDVLRADSVQTFALAESEIPEDHLKIWNLVRSAQAAALSAATNGTVAYKVDEAARTMITDAGYGQYFTHRLGHGIGLEMHEDPYLVGGSNAALATGHAFSDEPGVYIEGKVGVRLEDCFYVAEDGRPRYLTEKVGGAARSPWDL
jgi:Xaa-Pro aminopeptidase